MDAPPFLMLAQAVPDDFTPWFANLLLVLGALWMVVRLWKEFTPEPPLHQQYASRRDLAELEQEMDVRFEKTNQILHSRRTEADAKLESFRAEWRQRDAAIQAQLLDLGRSLGRLERHGGSAA